MRIFINGLCAKQVTYLVLFNLHKHPAETLLFPSEAQRSGLACPSHGSSEGEKGKVVRRAIGPQSLVLFLLLPPGKEDDD